MSAFQFKNLVLATVEKIDTNPEFGDITGTEAFVVWSYRLAPNAPVSFHVQATTRATAASLEIGTTQHIARPQHR